MQKKLKKAKKNKKAQYHRLSFIVNLPWRRSMDMIIHNSYLLIISLSVECTVK